MNPMTEVVEFLKEANFVTKDGRSTFESVDLEVHLTNA
jgi:hypothetical protein